MNNLTEAIFHDVLPNSVGTFSFGLYIHDYYKSVKRFICFPPVDPKFVYAQSQDQFVELDLVTGIGKVSSQNESCNSYPSFLSAEKFGFLIHPSDLHSIKQEYIKATKRFTASKGLTETPIPTIHEFFNIPEGQVMVDPWFTSRGNGTGVCNRIISENNEYKAIAHFAENGEISWYDHNLPEPIQRLLTFKAFSLYGINAIVRKKVRGKYKSKTAHKIPEKPTDNKNILCEIYFSIDDPYPMDISLKCFANPVYQDEVLYYFEHTLFEL